MVGEFAIGWMAAEQVLAAAPALSGVGVGVGGGTTL